MPIINYTLLLINVFSYSYEVFWAFHNCPTHSFFKICSLNLVQKKSIEINVAVE